MTEAEKNHIKIEEYARRIASFPISETDKLKLAVTFGMSLALKSHAGTGKESR